MRWSEAGYLSQIVLTHALRQASVSLIFDVGQNMKPEHPAKDLFWQYACNHFYMHHDGAYADYAKAGGGNQKDELQWRKEYIEYWVSQLGRDSLEPLRNLQGAKAVEALPQLLAIDRFEDDYSKFWHAFALNDISRMWHGDKLLKARAEDKSKRLWREILEEPAGITHAHRSELTAGMLEALHANSAEEYLINYSKNKLYE